MASILSPKKQTTPTVAAPAPMPDSNSEEVNAAKRRSTEAAMQRAGRASTILSGGDGYDSTKLGA